MIRVTTFPNELIDTWRVKIPSFTWCDPDESLHGCIAAPTQYYHALTKALRPFDWIIVDGNMGTKEQSQLRDANYGIWASQGAATIFIRYLHKDAIAKRYYDRPALGYAFLHFLNTRMSSYHQTLGAQRFLPMTSIGDFGMDTILSLLRARPTDEWGVFRNKMYFYMDIYTPWLDEPDTKRVKDPKKFAGMDTEIIPYFSANDLKIEKQDHAA